jgi:hypothetical protein
MKRNIVLVATVLLGVLGVWCYGAMHQRLELFESQTFEVNPEIVARAMNAGKAADLRHHAIADDVEVY